MTEEIGDQGLGPPASLCALLGELATELEGTERTETNEGHQFRRHGRVFAACHDGDRAASFRLRPEIVAAALKTGDTTASRRGPDWVMLRPETLDTFTLDRAEAWFEAAWRIAGEPPEKRAEPH